MRRWYGLLAIAVVAGAATAHAQDGNPQLRRGFWIGLGLGYGSLGCEDCDRLSGLSGYVKLGGTLSQKVLLGVEANGWTRKESGATLSYSNLSAVVYFYPSSTGGFHLKGGLGASRVDLDLGIGGRDKDTGGGILLGVGYDARVGRNFSLTPYLNLVGSNFDDSKVNLVQFGVGVTWH